MQAENGAPVSSRLQPEYKLWRTLWRSPPENGVPFFRQHAVTRDTTLTDPDIRVPDKCWLLDIPEYLQGSSLGISFPSPILFRDDYFEALLGVFRALSWEDEKIESTDVGSSDSECESGFQNPLLQRQRAVSRDQWRYSCFVLTGGPGIGKTLWLLVLLVLRLHAQLPTVYQCRDDCILFFDEDGPAQCQSVVDLLHSPVVRRHKGEEVWALVDANDNLQTVDMHYLFRQMFVIQAAPTDMKYTRWMRKLTFIGVHFVLQPWTLGELIVGRTIHLHAPSEHAIRDFSVKFGTANEAVYKYANAQKEYEAQILRKLSQPPPHATAFDKLGVDFPELIVIRPINAEARRWDYAPHFVSKYVVHLLFPSSGTARRSVEEAKRRFVQRLYGKFLVKLPHSRESALWIREASMRRSFQEGRVWPLYPPAGCSWTERRNRRNVPPPKRLIVEPRGVRVYVAEGSPPLAYPYSTSLSSEHRPEENAPLVEPSELSSGTDDILLEVDIDFVALYDRPTGTAVVLQPLRPLTPMPAFEEETRDRLQELCWRLEQEPYALGTSTKEKDPKILYVLVPTGGVMGDDSAAWLDVADLVDEVYDMEPEWEDTILSYGMFI